jgi:hypothetical protein
MNIEPVEAAESASAGDWPTDHEIVELAKNERISLFREAYAIADQYARISEAFTAPARLGRDDLSWCGFARWSSKAIGVELRLTGRSPFFRRLDRLYHVPTMLAAPFRRIMLILMGGSYSVGLSTANRSIFVEMASFHTQILDRADPVTILQAESPGPGRSLLAPLGDEGLDLLRTARDLLRKAECASGSARSELILGASIALSAYEQKRVQPALEYVFCRPARFCFQVVWKMPWLYLRRQTEKREDIYLVPRDAQTRFMRWVENGWIRMSSRRLWLRTAVNTIMLSRPLMAPPSGNLRLLRPAEDFECPQVTALVKEYGPPDTKKLTGVADWLDYDKRMSFIVAYFMLYQQVPKMFNVRPYKKPRLSWRKPRAVAPLGRLVFNPVEL